MELTMEHYLNSFPFEYYVVLRDVEALPRVLVDMLHEFFERAIGFEVLLHMHIVSK